MKRSRKMRRQAGYVLLIFLFMLALLTLAIITAAPAVARHIQRSEEEETIHRGQQYARAIRLFFRKFGRYPNSLDELKSANNLRFLRRDYKDPLDKEGQWKLIHVGESHFNPMGFFGKTLLPAGGNIPGAANIGTALIPSSGAPTTQPDGSQQAGGGQTAGSSDQSSSSNSSNPTFGGGPIVGVAPTRKGDALIVFNGKDKYEEWEFVYDPRMEQQLVPQAIPVQQPNQNPTQQPK